jgi:hypothetical protein
LSRAAGIAVAAVVGVAAVAVWLANGLSASASRHGEHGLSDKSAARAEIGGFAVVSRKNPRLVASLSDPWWGTTAIAPDGRGGWVVAGGHDLLGNLTDTEWRSWLLRVSDKGTSRWRLRVDGHIAALLRIDSTLYVGGTFRSIGGSSRANLAAVDVRTGLVLRWAPDVRGRRFLDDPKYRHYLVAGVYALVASGSSIYAGGFFDHVGGMLRRNLVALDARSGRPTGWNPGAGPWGKTVNALAINGAAVYAGGSFTEIRGKRREALAAINLVTGLPTQWRPPPIRYQRLRRQGDIFALAVAGSRIYIGGVFDLVAGSPGRALAALDTADGHVLSWHVPISGEVISVIVTDAASVYIGGGLGVGFTQVGGSPRFSLAEIDARTANVTDWNPRPNEGVSAIAIAGSQIAIGGNFTRVGGRRR